MQKSQSIFCSAFAVKLPILYRLLETKLKMICFSLTPLLRRNLGVFALFGGSTFKRLKACVINSTIGPYDIPFCSYSITPDADRTFKAIKSIRSANWPLNFALKFEILARKDFIIHTLRTKNLHFWCSRWKLYITRSQYTLHKNISNQYVKHKGVAVAMTSQTAGIYIDEMRCNFNPATLF